MQYTHNISYAFIILLTIMSTLPMLAVRSVLELEIAPGTKQPGIFSSKARPEEALSLSPSDIALILTLQRRQGGDYVLTLPK
jgi:hypothetical protein